MPLAVAEGAFAEVHRVLRKKGLFFVNLICADGILFAPEFCGEVLVDIEHEKGTIQLYYNWTLINKMIDGKFNILECKLTTEQWYKKIIVNKRYNLVLEKK
jgi:hypothetical protein